jgi:hypothetical protein
MGYPKVDTPFSEIPLITPMSSGCNPNSVQILQMHQTILSYREIIPYGTGVCIEISSIHPPLTGKGFLFGEHKKATTIF